MNVGDPGWINYSLIYQHFGKVSFVILKQNLSERSAELCLFVVEKLDSLFLRFAFFNSPELLYILTFVIKLRELNLYIVPIKLNHLYYLLTE